MTEKKGQMIGKPSKETTDKIDKVCKEVVLNEEIINLKKQLTDQLNQAKENFAMADRQMTLWRTRIEQISGSIATCNTLEEKKQIAKNLVFGNDHNKKGK